MKSTKAVKFVAFAAATLGILGNAFSAVAAEFGRLEVDQSRFLSVAIPGGSLVPFQLWLIRQNTPGVNCFSVSGSNPGVVQPLWRDNLSGCGTSRDSNAYSVFVGGEQQRGFSLVVLESNGELQLVGRDLRGQTFLVGRTGGISDNGYTAINLEPGWRISQRTIDGSPVNHFYYTNESTLADLLAGSNVAVGPTPNPDPRPDVQYPFPDIRNDIYATEITQAVALGLVSGQQDGTFRPTRPVTREEAASIIVEALKSKGAVPAIQVTQPPFPDVPANRWSAEKITLLKQAGIITGDQSGNFRPAATITRAELMSMLRRTAEVVASSQGTRPEELQPTGDVFRFTDIAGHWNEQTISIMSAYCGVATPFNERGTEFRPNADSLRNYTTAAVFRLLDCGRTPPPAQ